MLVTLMCDELCSDILSDMTVHGISDGTGKQNTLTQTANFRLSAATVLNYFFREIVASKRCFFFQKLILMFHVE